MAALALLSMAGYLVMGIDHEAVSDRSTASNPNERPAFGSILGMTANGQESGPALSADQANAQVRAVDVSFSLEYPRAARIGDRVKVELRADIADGLGVLTFSVPFDSESLSFVGAQLGELAAEHNALIRTSINGATRPGQVDISIEQPTGQPFGGQGTLAEFTFVVTGPLPERISFTMQDVEAVKTPDRPLTLRVNSAPAAQSDARNRAGSSKDARPS